MKHVGFILFLSIFIIMSCSQSKANTKDSEKNAIIESFTSAGIDHDSFTTPAGREVDLFFIKHGSIAIAVDGYVIYVDPVKMYGHDFSALPKADLLLVTHEHHDHFDTEAIGELRKDSTKIIMSKRVTELYGGGTPMLPGDTIEIENANFRLTAVPAYNTTPDHLQFHPRERNDIGFVFDIDGMRIYVAGDTEDIPEMANLGDIDIAFLPVNQPYTMTTDQALNAVKMIVPRVFYPYHYGNTDLSPLTSALASGKTELRIRNLQ